MRQRGFSLIEAMVSMAIFAIVAIVMVSTFLVGYRTISGEVRIIAADTAVSESSLSLVRDLNSADALPAGTIARPMMLQIRKPATWSCPTQKRPSRSPRTGSSGCFVARSATRNDNL